MATKFAWCAVVDARMRPPVIVVAPSDFEENARFDAAVKPFHAQALVAELAVGALVVSVSATAYRDR